RQLAPGRGMPLTGGGGPAGTMCCGGGGVAPVVGFGEPDAFGVGEAAAWATGIPDVPAASAPAAGAPSARAPSIRAGAAKPEASAVLAILPIAQASRRDAPFVPANSRK